MKCYLCGRRINENSNNWILKDGHAIHKHCPNEKPKLSKEESEKYKQLLDRIRYHLNMNPAGYVVNTGLNFKKVVMQIKQLKEKGYSYDDQLYALDEIVKTKDGFYGYTSVVNNITWIIDKKHKIEVKKQKIENNKDQTCTEQTYDLSDMIKEGEEEW